jgi:DNA-binding GntR family transcriptional regulator
MEVDRASSLPPYVQIADQLREMITSGRLEPGARLPSADFLVQDVGIARLTARKSLKLLRDEGWAYVSSGMGTYVAKREHWPGGDQATPPS